MKFDDLDARMRVYETEHDQLIPRGIFPVVRLDGRGFTRLTKELLDLEALSTAASATAWPPR